MRAHPAEYELVAPETLPGVLAQLAQEPGAWLPIAGGTDVMVQYSAGQLRAKKLVSIWNLPELRRIDILPDEIRIGAGCTYTDLQRNDIVRREFPLLASAARCTGSVANQNRGTLGGNIVNASPAADSLPALLVYDAELILVSLHGERRIAYDGFHTGYRTTQKGSDELVQSICLARSFSQYRIYARKIGARNAQAISKVCIAALGRVNNGIVEDVRIAVGSVAPIPIRLPGTEDVIRGKHLDATLVSLAKQSARREVTPIDDIRSSATYRAAVTGNLVAEFLHQWNPATNESSNNILAYWNSQSSKAATIEILPCCGSHSWAQQMAARRPILDQVSLVAASDEICVNLSAAAWIEAFAHHPRIGERAAPAIAPKQSAAWSGEEQQKVASAADKVAAELAEGNRAYEQRFGRTFIVCASGKSAEDILLILQRRLNNDEHVEFKESAEQQRQITNLRLKKWISA